MITKTTNNNQIENVVLVYVQLPNSDVEQDLYELTELVRTAKGEIALTCSQKRNSIDVANVLGTGKLDEIAQAISCCDKEISVALFSCQLNATQRRVLKDILNVDVIDKIDLILDIFALRATTSEGKKQVEMAQLSYNMATKPEGNFSRQGGGIGTRGPGETKLETNKRAARERLYNLKQELDKIAKQRQVTRQKRQDNDIFTVALVGYTNAGKSTLFNKLTNTGVYADNLLFATLDTTTRKLALPNGVEILVCDTVGFIRDLPHTLVNAFKSTLEEARFADLILNVCDVSDSNVSSHIAVTEQLLEELQVDAPIIRVYNKIDKQQGGILTDYDGEQVFVSAKTGKNIDCLLDKIQQIAMQSFAKVTLRVNYTESQSLISKLNSYTRNYTITYDETDVIIHAIIRRKYLDIFVKYITI